MYCIVHIYMYSIFYEYNNFVKMKTIISLFMTILWFEMSITAELPKPDGRAKILAFLPTEIRSHFHGFRPLLTALVTRGHDLTLVSPFSLTDDFDQDMLPLPPYRYIRVEASTEPRGMNHLDENRWSNKLPGFLHAFSLGPFVTRKALDKPAVRNFVLNDRSAFDLVIVENFYHECFVTLGHKYNVPVIQLLSFVTNPRVSQWQSNPFDPSYIPDINSGYVAPLTFAQRVVNTVSALFNTWINRLVYVPQQRAIMREYFTYDGYETRPDLEIMLRNVSLTMINMHPLISPVVPLVPSYVQIAGMHIKPTKTLPDELKIIMDTTKQGVVYFSMGSILKPSLMPKQRILELLHKLSTIKQTVLWRWDGDQIPDLPPNVIVRKWFPQNDILAHPNCLLFITHGGIHSLVESIHHGVPMLSIPVFSDQMQNSAQVESRGLALNVPYFEFTADNFGTKLQTLLNDPKFRENAKKASSIMQDNPISILNNAVYWIEYVIRYKGAVHLQTATNHLYWFQYYLLDIIVFILITLSFAWYLMYKCTSYTINKFEKPIKKSLKK